MVRRVPFEWTSSQRPSRLSTEVQAFGNRAILPSGSRSSNPARNCPTSEALPAPVHDEGRRFTTEQVPPPARPAKVRHGAGITVPLLPADVRKGFQSGVRQSHDIVRDRHGMPSYDARNRKGRTVAISTERHGSVLAIKAEGRIDGSNAADFLKSVEGVIDQNDTGVILDFSDLNYISSAGLRIILLIAKDLRQRSVMFAVCSLSSSVAEIFMISGFDQIIDLHADSAAAIAALQ